METKQLKEVPSSVQGPRHRRVVDFSPIPWNKHFDKIETITLGENSFRIYVSGFEDAGDKPVLVLLHGGGYSSLTWALFTTEIRKKLECCVIALDLRGHGSTKTVDDSDLSIEAMSKDVNDVINSYISDRRFVLVGHSMGGAVAVEVAMSNPNVCALCVIDVVEGTALPALSSMQTILRGRPSNFETLEKAISWCYQSGQTRNRDAARVSMPGQIINTSTETLASDEVLNGSSECEQRGYKWRTELAASEKYWHGWFTGMSKKFLACCPPKLLLLANIHGLDTELTVGQMQGKFQMQVMAKSGHAVHEDLPDQIADVLSRFLIRHKIAVPVQ